MQNKAGIKNQVCDIRLISGMRVDYENSYSASENTGRDPVGAETVFGKGVTCFSAGFGFREFAAPDAFNNLAT